MTHLTPVPTVTPTSTPDSLRSPRKHQQAYDITGGAMRAVQKLLTGQRVQRLSWYQNLQVTKVS